jgi:hypothetical protein
MARPIFPHEISDPDFQWLIKNYCESRGPVAVVDVGCLPLVMVLLDENAAASNAHLMSPDVLSTIGAAYDEAFIPDEPKEP